MFRLGLIINPLAGLGGSVALKGSDGAAIVKAAMTLGAKPQAQSRVRMALEQVHPLKQQIHIYTAANEMGEYLCQDMGFDVTVIADNTAGDTHAEDTEKAVVALVKQGIDLLVFAGGDGTARNVFNALQALQKIDVLPVIGIPAGCKIHSAVYAVTPVHAGELLSLLIRGRPLAVKEASVMDIDEEAFRHDQVKARRYGHLIVPAENQYMQNMKEGGVEHEELVLQDIAAFVIDGMEDDVLYFVGSGTTPKAIMDELGLASTLLGVDVVKNRELLASDVNEQQILALLEDHPRAKIILTIIGGQGHLLGRGNQQFSPEVLRHIGKENIKVIATAAKIRALDGQPIRVDSGDEKLNDELSAMTQVITGYDEQVLYKIG
ncbi:MAG: ATP-NAD kinase family protein [Gammaproteobacteria bacterium]|nr:ATP-NAD kinase family protein [Gammaproteobacteria bacterium]